MNRREPGRAAAACGCSPAAQEEHQIQDQRERGEAADEAHDEQYDDDFL